MQNQILLLLAGELSPGEAATVRDHLRACPGCAAAARQLAAVQNRVKAVLPLSVSAPSTLDKRVLASIRRTPPSRPVPGFFTMPRGRTTRLVAACATLAILGSGYFVKQQLFPTAAYNAQLSGSLQMASFRDDYLGWLRGTQSVSVTGSDARQVSTRMVAMHDEGRCIVTPVTFQTPGAQMVGGCWHQVQGSSLAFMAYHWNGQSVSLYQSRQEGVSLPSNAQRTEPSGIGSCYWVGQDDGVSYVVWGTGETRYVLVAQVQPDQLLNLARSAQGAV